MAAEKAPSLLSATLASGSSLVLLQVFSRVVTFVLNQALVRLVSPQVFGTTSIQFELLLSTILFLSREGDEGVVVVVVVGTTTPRLVHFFLNCLFAYRGWGCGNFCSFFADFSIFTFFAGVALREESSHKSRW